MTGLALLHTADVHCATFDALRDRIAPSLALNHHVRSEWLAQARDGISASLETTIVSMIKKVDGPVLCTCTTLGPVAEAAGALRIDRPLMHAAAQTGGPVLLAYCLESTRKPSLALLQEEITKQEGDVTVRELPLTALWPLFEAGQVSAFETGIAEAVRGANPPSGCVVLAQASMAGASTHLTDLTVPVLSSPELALRAALARL